MILAVSRFRVENGMETQVRAAYVDRPRLVDSVAGFLGMETFTDRGDHSTFYLVTRWTDHESFRAWNRGAAHHDSHQFIPKGLRLDASATQMWLLDRIEPPEVVVLPQNGKPRHRAMAAEHLAVDAAPLVARFLDARERVYLLTAAPDGTVTSCNGALEARLLSHSWMGGSVDVPMAIRGRQLWDLLTLNDAQTLRSRLAARTVHCGSAERTEIAQNVVLAGGRGEPELLNFVDADQAPFTIRCHLDVQPCGVLLIGEACASEDALLGEQLLVLNNELVARTRDLARQQRELRQVNAALAAAKAQLQAALDDLNASHWHIKRMQEVLPICVECGRVEVSATLPGAAAMGVNSRDDEDNPARVGLDSDSNREAIWQDVVQFLKERSLFLSHSYCPVCAAALKKDLEEQEDEFVSVARGS